MLRRTETYAERFGFLLAPDNAELRIPVSASLVTQWDQVKYGPLSNPGR